jgi:peptidoglycan hydrolase-like protein with peptidoglycan-binding domain
VKYDLIDCCPAPVKLLPVLTEIKRVSGCTYQSIARMDAVEDLLAKCHKHTQRYLYEHQNEPGFNPANPPGYSTHELRSDGVAYRFIRRGLPLPFYWMIGIDIDDADVDEARRVALNHGWLLIQPYPSGSEHHHVNFVRAPIIRRPQLKKGDKGRRVRKLIRDMKYLVHVKGKNKGKQYLTGSHSSFDGEVVTAVRAYQREHNLRPDGQVGIHTAANIKASVRRRKQNVKDNR